MYEDITLQRERLVPLSFGDEDRSSWLTSELKKLAPGKRILDAGAGPCKYKELCAHLDYVSQDFSEYDGRGDGHGLQRGSWDISEINIISDITRIPEPDDSFDAILCTAVLEHLPDPILAMKEFFRLLAPNGTLLLTAPFSSSTHFSPFHYYSGFTRYFYETHLINIGFRIENMHPNGDFFQFIRSLLSNLPQFVEGFSSTSLTDNDMTAISTLMLSMERASGKQRKADELLNFGYEVVAKKDICL